VIAAPELTFDKGTHTYRLDGTVIRSVTQHLQGLHSFAHVPDEVLSEAQWRGQYVHDLTHADDMGELDDDGVLPEYMGYLVGWRTFKRRYVPMWERIETMAFSTRHLYAGTPDREGVLSNFSRDRWVVDVKTASQSHPVWGLQLAAYRQMSAERDAGWALARRATVQLHADGGYTFTEWRDANDLPTFLNLVNLNRWVDAKCR
jgi:hypothetical protein